MIPPILRRRAVLVTLVVGIPLSIAFLWLALRGADLHAVRAALTQANVGLVALAIAALASMSVLAGVRWRAIARTPTVSTPRFVEMIWSGTAVNDIAPGRIGEFLRARWLSVAAGIPGGRAFATVMVDRIFDVAALVVFLAVSLPFVTGAEWLRRIAVGSLILLGAVLLLLFAARLYTRHRGSHRHDRGLIRRLARDTVEGLAQPLGRKREAALLGLSLAMWVVWGVGAWLVARSLGIHLSTLDIVFVTAVINLGIAIPSSPGFIGTYQWLAVSALGLLHVDRTDALAFAILLHAVWYVPTLLVGGALLIRRAVVAVKVATPAQPGPLEASDA